MREELEIGLCTRAAAKINLGLFVGPARADGMHELVSVMQSISLADELTLELAPAGSSQDVVVCPGVPGPAAHNLAARALSLFRGATGWDAPALRLSIDKRIPLAAGLAGGSTDAAGTLRLAAHASGLGEHTLLERLAGELGADVPAALTPGRWLAGGVGERLEPLPNPIGSLGLLVLPVAHELSTAAVYAHADSLQTVRSQRELEDKRRALVTVLSLGTPAPSSDLLTNDLQRAAVDLCPEIKKVLRQAADSGADEVLLSGSGPTVIGLFLRANPLARVARAIAGLPERVPEPIAAEAVGGEFGAVWRRGASQSIGI